MALSPGQGTSLCHRKMPHRRWSASRKDSSPGRKHKPSASLSLFIRTKHTCPERPNPIWEKPLNAGLRLADISKASQSPLSTAHSHNSRPPPIICGRFVSRTRSLHRRFLTSRHLMTRLDYKHQLIFPTCTPEESHKWQLFKFPGKVMIPKEAKLIRALAEPDNRQPLRGKLFIIVCKCLILWVHLRNFYWHGPFINVCAGKDSTALFHLLMIFSY